jgi:hypothetical protein
LDRLKRGLSKEDAAIAERLEKLQRCIHRQNSFFK